MGGFLATLRGIFSINERDVEVLLSSSTASGYLFLRSRGRMLGGLPVLVLGPVELRNQTQELDTSNS